MNRFDFYGQLRGYMGALYRKHCGLSKKAFRRTGKDSVEEATKLFFEHPRSSETLDSLIIAEELQYEELGRQVYIPEDKKLLEMLWRSKMNVTLADLMEFPRCFSIAWPAKTRIDGVDLLGCLIWFGPQEEREGLGRRLDKYVPGVKWEARGNSDGLGRVLHMSFGRGPATTRWYSRASMPEAWMNKCLQSEESFKDTLGTYDLPSSVNLNPAEQHEQFVMLKLALRLMVYATACPQALVRMWPEGIATANERKGKSPRFLKAPEQAHYGKGTHASPEPHYRNMYFRRYPVKKDGTRTPGILQVDGHMVNARMNPTTVMNVD